MQVGAKNSSFVNGRLIKEDRTKRKLSQEALVENARRSFSLSTLKRAERSGRISQDKIDSIAKALEQEPTRYVLKEGEPQEVEEILQLSGRWKAFYVEDDTGVPAYLVTETVTVVQDGITFQGEYVCDTYERPDNFVLIGQIDGNMVSGRYFVPKRASRIGKGFCQLLSSRNSNWLDGCCAWYDYDSGKIEYSRNIWVRVDQFYYNTLLKQAGDIMSTEVKIVRMQKKCRYRR